MKLALIGGGGFRVPLVIGALLEDVARGAGVVDTVVLYDTNPAALATMDAVLRGQRADFEAVTGPGGGSHSSGPGTRLDVRTTSELDDALRGADFVFSAIRVGGLHGRVLDERVALEAGVLGQETVGAGGLSYALRTLPVTNALAQRIAEVAPDAWLINFTNPAGIVTEAASAFLGNRVIGICDSPVGLIRRACRAAGIDPADARADYAGLNHLGWLNSLSVDGVDRLPELIDSDAVSTFEEGQLFGKRWLSILGSLPNEYLDYYYRRDETLRSVREATVTRGEEIERDVGAFFARTGRGTTPDDAYAGWLATRQAREAGYMADNRAAAGMGERDERDLSGGGYEGVALELMRRLAGQPAGDSGGDAEDAGGDELILNVPGRGAIDCLPGDAIVEVPCTVSPAGAQPARDQHLSLHQQSLVSAVKAAEREVIAAAESGSRAAAERAFAYHPLIASAPMAKNLVDGYERAFPGLRQLLSGAK